MAECVTLSKRFPRLRVRMSADHVPGERLDPWNEEVICGRWKARIYPHGGERLQAMIRTAYIRMALAELKAAGAEPFQVARDEATVIFGLADFDRVAAVLRPKLKRRPGGRPFAPGAAPRPRPRP
jgi:hypothetical protein